jgi:hypothetical protein
MALRISQNQSATAASMIRSPTNNRKAVRRYSGSVTIVAIRRRRAVMSPPSIATLQISHQVIAPKSPPMWHRGGGRLLLGLAPSAMSNFLWL